MYKKVQLLFHLDENKPLNLFEEKLASEARLIQASLPKGTSQLTAIRPGEDPTRNTVHSKEVASVVESFDAVFEVGAESGDLKQLAFALRELIGHLDGWIDPSRSAVVAGTEHVILPGDEPFLLVFAIRRLPSLTVKAYHDYWLNKHAEVARRVPVLRAYRQFHADEDATEEAGKILNIGITDFNGAAQGYFRDIKDFLEIMAQPEVTTDALEDEKKFIDHSRSAFGLYRVL
jgi:hypothetical protein